MKEYTQALPGSDPEDRARRNNHTMGDLLRISRCSATYRARTLQTEDLPPGRHYYINYICRHPGSTQEQIARAVCHDKTTVTRLLGKLEKDGYITREVSPKDARCRLVYPTQKAEQLQPRIHQALHEFMEYTMQGMTPEEQDILSRLLSGMSERARQLLEETERREES